MSDKVVDELLVSETCNENGHRGAKVFGSPISRNVASYMDDVSDESQHKRLISMFFGDKFLNSNQGLGDDF